MNLFLLAVVFALALVSPQSSTRVAGRDTHGEGWIVAGSVRLMHVSSNNYFSVAVTVPKGTKADRAIVTIGYRTPVDGIERELFLTKVSAIELIPETWVMADAVPVSRHEIAWVDVVLVKDVERQRFQFEPLQGR